MSDPRDDPDALAAALRVHCTRLQNYDLTPARAEQLTQEVEPLIDAVARIACRLRFEDEPASITVALRAGKRMTGRGGA